MINGINVGKKSMAYSGFVSIDGIIGSNIGKITVANSGSEEITGIKVCKISGANSGCFLINGSNVGKTMGTNSGSVEINGSNDGIIMCDNSGFAINGIKVCKMVGVNSLFIVERTVEDGRLILVAVCRRSLINRDVCSISIEFIRLEYAELIRSSLPPCAICCAMAISKTLGLKQEHHIYILL